MTADPRDPPLVRTARLMGTVFSVHVRTERVLPSAVRLHAASSIDAFFAELSDIERIFSPFRSSSHVSRLRDGRAQMEDLDARVPAVAELCRAFQNETRGRFSAWRGGWFDPTGVVKGWAAEEAAVRWLRPLLDLSGVGAVAVNAGGDVRVFSAPSWERPWRVGIADPRQPGAVIATIDVRDGAVATSGLAERGAHITDPRDGRAATRLASATVVADTLTIADVWATAACVAGEDLSWIRARSIRSGLIVSSGGVIRRWAAGVEIRTAAASETLNESPSRGHVGVRG